MLSCNQSDKIEPQPEPTPTIKRETFDASNIAQGFNPANFSMAVFAQELIKHMNILQAIPVAAPTQHPPSNKGNANIVNAVSSNFVQATHLQGQMSYTWMEPESEGNDAPPITQREMEEIGMLESLIASTQKKVDETKKRIAKSGPTTRSCTRQEALAPKQASPTQQINKEVSETQQSAAPASQFRYHTPIEDAKTISKVANQTLDVSITLPIRDLLSILPDVRRHIKEQIVTKRVTTASANAHNANTVECFMAALPERSDNIIVADHSVNLRVLDLLLNDKVQVEAILDEGSQIVGLRKDIWEKLGLPIRSDHKMNMVSANASSNQTIGLIHNLKVTIRAYNFYLQVQVVENASYEMLLGRPFLTLTEANTQHRANSDLHITLQDPNSKAILTLPTRARGNTQDKQSSYSYIAMTNALNQVSTYSMQVPTENTETELKTKTNYNNKEVNKTENLAYQKVANKTKPIAATSPEEFKIVQRIQSIHSLIFQYFPHPCQMSSKEINIQRNEKKPCLSITPFLPESTTK